MEGGNRQQEAEELRDGGETEKKGTSVEKKGSSQSLSFKPLGKRELDSCGSGNPNNEDHQSSLGIQQGDDDWEAIADLSPDDLLSPLSLPNVSNLSLEGAQVQGIKRRGRGTFSYMKDALYSDGPMPSGTEETDDSPSQARESVRCATGHVLVLADFPLSTTTADLEKLLETFKDHGFVIRWVNGTTALAVFKSSSVALEARTCIKCPFTVRVLGEADELLSSIPPRDLEPVPLRPKTSARTAQRLIAQSMGIKLPSTTFGSGELRKQEAARKNRIVTRQNMRDDAWGDDAN